MSPGEVHAMTADELDAFQRFMDKDLRAQRREAAKAKAKRG